MFIQLSDLHIDVQQSQPSERLTTCIKKINTLSPDLVLLTGDLVDRGDEPSTLLLKTLLQDLNSPYYLIPGNHDSRELLRHVFGQEHGYLGKQGSIDYAIPYRKQDQIVMLDTTRYAPNGRVLLTGQLSVAQLAWLEQILAACSGSSILAMHHPPVNLSGLAESGYAFFEAFMAKADGVDEAFLHADHFYALLAQYPQVKMVLAGHLHGPLSIDLPVKVPCLVAPTTYKTGFYLGKTGQFEYGHAFLPPAFSAYDWPDGGAISATIYYCDLPAYTRVNTLAIRSDPHDNLYHEHPTFADTTIDVHYPGRIIEGCVKYTYSQWEKMYHQVTHQILKNSGALR